MSGLIQELFRSLQIIEPWMLRVHIHIHFISDQERVKVVERITIVAEIICCSIIVRIIGKSFISGFVTLNVHCGKIPC